MAAAGEEVARLPEGTIALKWPNDLVVEAPGGLRKLAGVLGETDGIGTDDPRAVIGIGVNGAWSRDEFPADLADAMTSLAELASGQIDHDTLLTLFVDRLEPRVDELRHGQFDGLGWCERQVTTDRDVDLVGADGSRTTVNATGVDVETGALLVDGRPVFVGEIAHVRLSDTVAARGGV